MVMPFPDAMQEFKVETSGVSAQRANSTAVAVGDQIGHESSFTAVCSSSCGTTCSMRRTFLPPSIPDGKEQASTLKRNQFGGTAGRADCAQSTVLLRRISGHHAAAGSGRPPRFHSDCGDAGRRLDGVDVTGLQRTAGRLRCGRHSSTTASIPRLYSQARAGNRQLEGPEDAVPDDGQSVRRGHLRQHGPRPRTSMSAKSTISRRSTTPCSAA